MPVDLVRTTPLYTTAQAARYLGVPPSTLGTWAHGYERILKDRSGKERRVTGEPIITAQPPRRGQPSIPFFGLAEAFVLVAFRRAGVSLQHIRRCIPILQKLVGLEHALASERLYTDGQRILYDFAQRVDDPAARRELEGLTVVVGGQRVIAEAVRDYLQRITYADDGLAVELVLPYAERDLLRVRPDQAGGQPLFLHGRAPLEHVLGRWKAGDRIKEIAKDFGLSADDVEDAIRLIQAA
ncbi:MAG: DUF433 domain-containing protein [Chloroflexi bacterium]|nr:DUF433 domain-containing protein [Chloroflexota bacterium]